MPPRSVPAAEQPAAVEQPAAEPAQPEIAAEQPAAVEQPAAEPAQPEIAAEPVRARWVSPQACFVPTQGWIRYGDEIWVSPGQLDHPDQPTIPWDDDWTADTAIAEMAALEG